MSTVAADSAKRLEKHLDVIDTILDDWAVRGRTSGESGRDMLIFACSFLLLDILQIRKRDVWANLLTRFRDILLAHYTVDAMNQLLSADRLRSTLLLLCSDTKGPNSFGRFSIYSAVRSIYGCRAAFMRFFGDVRHVLTLPYWLVRSAIAADVDFDDCPSIDEAVGELQSRAR